MPDPARTLPMLDRLVDAIRKCLPRPLASQSIERSHHLREDLALDSLGLISLAALLEDALGLELSPHTERLAAALTVGQLEQVLLELEANAA